MSPSVIEIARERISAIDQQLVTLLAERMQQIRTVAEHKRSEPGQPLQDLVRERQVFATWVQEAESHGLSPYYVGRILRAILNYSRRVQEGLLDRSQEQYGLGRKTLGFQGIVGSNSALAAGKLSVARGDKSPHLTGFGTFAAVVNALQAGEIDYALLPIENTIAGSIQEVYRLLDRSELSIVDEELLPIEHTLLALPGTKLEDLRIIQSHPVALQQCDRFLSALGHCRRESYWDTAAAAKSVATHGNPEVAAIAPAECAELFGLDILATEVADHEGNETRFVLVAREPEDVAADRPARVSLVLSVRHERGSLSSCLETFARHGINLSKIESRPQPDSPWEYRFYIDLEGNLIQPSVSQALDAIRSHVRSLRILGCYPRRDRAAEELSTDTLAETDGESEKPPHELPVAEIRTSGVPVRREVQVGPVIVGGARFVLMAGPCAVENRQQIHDAAELVKSCGASILRGGAFKPRTSPYSFQGLGPEGLELLARAGEAYDLPIVTEVIRPEDVELVASYASVLQVGARNMQNYALLKKLGTVDRPVLLKRGLSATIDEWLAAAEYIRAGGNMQVILCERGIRTFETATRSTLDVSAVPVVQQRCDLPIVVDPSHAAGQRHLVVPLALAAAAAGADGLLVEVHPRPEEALCDRDQALTRQDLEQLVALLQPVVGALSRTL
jgi:3-deoxy-7-phosphoheptulonate synthase